MGEILLEARGLSKGFPGVWEHLILDHLDFDVRAGEVHTLLGENKTRLDVKFVKLVITAL